MQDQNQKDSKNQGTLGGAGGESMAGVGGTGVARKRRFCSSSSGSEASGIDKAVQDSYIKKITDKIRLGEYFGWLCHEIRRR